MCIELFELFGASFILVMGLMTILWAISCKWDNVGIVDLGWALGFVLAIIAYWYCGDGYWLKRWLLTLMVTAWGGRLFWHLGKRFDYRVEDPRYSDLKAKFGRELLNFKMLLMFHFQGLLVIVLTLPFVLVCGYADSQWHFIELLGILVWAGGLCGEAIADNQLETFKAAPGNRGKVCNTGLWKYSRHPNYFFEWVVWLGFFLFAFPTAGWIALLSPIIILLLLTQVSGIPLAEQQALKSKGDAYRKYQEATSAFVPWPFGKF